MSFKINKHNWLIISLITGIFIFGIIYYSSFIYSQQVCCSFSYEWETRGAKRLHYTYKVNKFKYSGDVSIRELKIRDIESLKKIKCIQVEYSEMFPSFSRIVDKRVLK